MEGITIEIDGFAYQELKQAIEEQEEIFFRRDGSNDLISISNPNKSKPNNTGNEKNIVQKWMEDIREIAERGYQEANDSDSERHFSRIKSYCKAVIVSVTSS